MNRFIIQKWNVIRKKLRKSKIHINYKTIISTVRTHTILTVNYHEWECKLHSNKYFYSEKSYYPDSESIFDNNSH